MYRKKSTWCEKSSESLVGHSMEMKVILINTWAHILIFIHSARMGRTTLPKLNLADIYKIKPHCLSLLLFSYTSKALDVQNSPFMCSY